MKWCGGEDLIGLKYLFLMRTGRELLAPWNRSIDPSLHLTTSYWLFDLSIELLTFRLTRPLALTVCFWLSIAADHRSQRRPTTLYQYPPFPILLLIICPIREKIDEGWWPRSLNRGPNPRRGEYDIYRTKEKMKRNEMPGHGRVVYTKKYKYYRLSKLYST